jgi:ABC-type amino acid transport substrate-binding protein
MNNQLLCRSLLLGALGTLLAGSALAGSALDRIRDTGHLRLAYLPGAKPFTSPGANGGAEGYSAALCERIAARVKTQLGLQQLAVDWVTVRPDNVLNVVAAGEADVLCTPTNATLERRKTLSYSLPVFAGGIRAVVRNDVSPALRDVLEANPATRNVWRGSPALTLLEKTTFATVAGTSSEKWLAGKVSGFKLNTVTVSVPDYASGLKFLQERKVDVFLAERDVVLASMDNSARTQLIVLSRQLTHEPLALALPRGDEDFRLLVDTELTAAYNSPEFPSLYVKHFGKLDDATRNFFTWVTPPP